MTGKFVETNYLGFVKFMYVHVDYLKDRLPYRIGMFIFAIF